MEIERRPVTKQMRFAKIDQSFAPDLEKGSVLPIQPGESPTQIALEQAATGVAAKFNGKQILWIVLGFGAGVGLSALYFYSRSKKQKAELDNKYAGQIFILRTMLRPTDSLSGVKTETTSVTVQPSPVQLPS